jgi:hypothetical protein
MGETKFHIYAIELKHQVLYLDISRINLLKPTGYRMHQQVKYLNNCTLCPHRIYVYVFCIYLRTNGDLCHLQHKLVGFYNRDEMFTARYGLGH